MHLRLAAVDGALQSSCRPPLVGSAQVGVAGPLGGRRSHAPAERCKLDGFDARHSSAGNQLARFRASELSALGSGSGRRKRIAGKLTGQLDFGRERRKLTEPLSATLLASGGSSESERRATFASPCQCAGAQAAANVSQASGARSERHALRDRAPAACVSSGRPVSWPSGGERHADCQCAEAGRAAPIKTVSRAWPSAKQEKASRNLPLKLAQPVFGGPHVALVAAACNVTLVPLLIVRAAWRSWRHKETPFASRFKLLAVRVWLLSLSPWFVPCFLVACFFKLFVAPRASEQQRTTFLVRLCARAEAATEAKAAAAAAETLENLRGARKKELTQIGAAIKRRANQFDCARYFLHHFPSRTSVDSRLRLGARRSSSSLPANVRSDVRQQSFAQNSSLSARCKLRFWAQRVQHSTLCFSKRRKSLQRRHTKKRPDVGRATRQSASRPPQSLDLDFCFRPVASLVIGSNVCARRRQSNQFN